MFLKIALSSSENPSIEFGVFCGRGPLCDVQRIEGIEARHSQVILGLVHWNVVCPNSNFPS